MDAQEAVPDRVERAAPRPPGVGADEASGPREHLSSRPPTEREQEDPLGARASLDQRGHPRRQRHRLAAAGPGDDQQWSVAVQDRGALFRVQVVEHAFGG
jgi:hypothetical protein